MYPDQTITLCPHPQPSGLPTIQNSYFVLVCKRQQKEHGPSNPGACCALLLLIFSSCGGGCLLGFFVVGFFSTPRNTGPIQLASL